jgi:putative ABC transport system permease protein
VSGVKSTGEGGLAAWRFASRLARREVRRRPGRTLLVVILVALPVLAMTLGSVLARTNDADAGIEPWRAGTDVAVTHSSTQDVDVSEAIPEGSRIDRVAAAEWAPIQTGDGNTISGVTLAGALAPSRDENALAFNPLAVDGGRAPDTDEVWLSDSIADRLGLEAGDSLTLDHPSGAWTVSGTGRLDDDFGRQAIVFGQFPIDQVRRDQAQQALLIDVPGTPSSGDLDRLGRSIEQLLPGAAASVADGWSMVEWSGRNVGEGVEIDRSGLAWGWVAGAIALAAMGIIIAAAFATSARRQLVTLGLLSANGASQQLARRTMALQGFWTGVIGSLTGIAVGIVALVAGRSTLERIVDQKVAAYQFAVLDLVVIALTGIAAATIAASIPARTATRVPVISALAGRRPLGVVPRRLVPIGLCLFALGVFLLVVAASTTDGGDAAAAAAVLGGLAVLAGTCCASPLAIDAMSRASAWVGRSWRFAGRSLARTRHRSAAVVTAIAVTAAVAVAGSSMAMAIDDPEGDDRYLPDDAVLLTSYSEWPTPQGRPRMLDFQPMTDHPVDAALRDEVDGIVPSADWKALRFATWDTPPFRERRGLRASDGDVAITPDVLIVVADEPVLDLYELDATDRAALESTGALLLQSWYLSPDVSGQLPDTVTVVTESGEIDLPVAPRAWVVDKHAHPNEDIRFDGIRGPFAMMVTEEAAQSAGLDIVERGALVRSDSPLTRSQRDELGDAVYDTSPELGYFYRDVPVPADQYPWSLDLAWSEWQPSRALVQAAIVAAALLLTLIVVAIGLSLAATESRDERDVLVAVGARPATMRQMAGAKAVVITLTGVLLAIPTGLVPLAAVMRTVDEPFRVPWLAIAGLVVAVPVVAGLAAWAVSSLAQRARPVHMSTLAFD